jgi:hypothetical protein
MMTIMPASPPPLLKEEPGIRCIGYREQPIGQHNCRRIVCLCQPGDDQTAPSGAAK